MAKMNCMQEQTLCLGRKCSMCDMKILCNLVDTSENVQTAVECGENTNCVTVYFVAIGLTGFSVFSVVMR